MTATPSSPPRKAGGASRGARKGESLKTALLHVALFSLIAVVSLFGTAMMMSVPYERRGGVAGVGIFLAFSPGLPLFTVSVVVSVMLIAFHKRSSYVPLLAGAVIIVCAIVGFILILANAAQ